MVNALSAESETIKLNLFQEVENTRFESISNCQYKFVVVAGSIPVAPANQKNIYWGVAQW
ncbi:MAG: hypothetical protein K1X72_10155 [Pyrinomonadaceae bacterium]|nr:hypothetical protein [Pyrinomonadaceae bacterium]